MAFLVPPFPVHHLGETGGDGIGGPLYTKETSLVGNGGNGEPHASTFMWSDFRTPRECKGVLTKITGIFGGGLEAVPLGRVRDAMPDQSGGSSPSGTPGQCALPSLSPLLSRSNCGMRSSHFPLGRGVDFDGIDHVGPILGDSEAREALRLLLGLWVCAPSLAGGHRDHVRVCGCVRENW